MGELVERPDASLPASIQIDAVDRGVPRHEEHAEDTNGLLRQYFPKGTDLSVFGPEDLEPVAQDLNGRPRKTLSFDTPDERMRDLIPSA